MSMSLKLWIYAKAQKIYRVRILKSIGCAQVNHNMLSLRLIQMQSVCVKPHLCLRQNYFTSTNQIVLIITFHKQGGVICEDSRSRVVRLHSIVLLIEAVMFGLFVLTILYDQIEAIIHDETGIEQLAALGSGSSDTPKLSYRKVLLRHICRLPCQSYQPTYRHLPSHTV
ncbi:hypothetical protein M8J77_003726 [Diaphorina citri]|nr:hypothetical protein M8J77_003726 [Diaphorina citri]